MDTEIVKITTPKNILLDAIWLGNPRSKTVFIFVHGLGSSAFSNLEFLSQLVNNNNSSVLSFNNRGHGIISRIIKIDKRRKKKKGSFLGGQTHEVFTDCVDDISGALNLVNNDSIKNVFLVGHSTGTQKIIYYLSKKRNPKIKGIILLSPLVTMLDL